jgi:hypothetical protein
MINLSRSLTLAFLFNPRIGLRSGALKLNPLSLLNLAVAMQRVTHKGWQTIKSEINSRQIMEPINNRRWYVSHLVTPTGSR